MSRRRHRHEEHEEHENHERWLITYADMITLLMVLFIVLFAMGQMDLKKFAAFRSGLDQLGNRHGERPIAGGAGVMPGPAAVAVLPEAAAQALREKNDQAQAAQVERRTLESVQNEIEGHLHAQAMSGRARFRLEERGLVVTVVSDDVLFDLGSAELRPEGRRVLDALAPALARLPNPVRIEGHTDDHPVRGGPYPSNWELSTARATSVLRYLVQAHGLQAGRLEAGGYADQRPLAPNDGPQNRALNRRVEVVLLATAESAKKEVPRG